MYFWNLRSLEGAKRTLNSNAGFLLTVDFEAIYVYLGSSKVIAGTGSMEEFATKNSNHLAETLLSEVDKNRQSPKNTFEVAYPVDTSVQITRLFEEYERTKKPIPVSFRKLVPWLKVGNRATHYIHPYPAKLFPQIAHFFLASDLLAAGNATVLDPFSGSGTVALETVLSGRSALYADKNPFARLITKAKTTPLDISILEGLLAKIHKYYKSSRYRTRPDVVNLELWYSEKKINSLIRLRKSIETICPENAMEHMLIVFSATCKKVSNADPRFNVPVRLKERNSNTGEREHVPNKFEDVWEVFEKLFRANLKRQHEFGHLYKKHMNVECVGNDARHLIDPKTNETLENESVELIITSPPYAGAQKYIRSSSLSLGWLDLCKSTELKNLEKETIGREHFPKQISCNLTLTGVKPADRLLRKVYKINPLRACIASFYIREMKASMEEMFRVLKPGGHIVLVIGNNKICGYDFLSSDYLTELLANLGAEILVSLVDSIPSRVLTTKRAKTASVINTETVLVFRKPDN